MYVKISSILIINNNNSINENNNNIILRYYKFQILLPFLLVMKLVPVTTLTYLSWNCQTLYFDMIPDNFYIWTWQIKPRFTTCISVTCLKKYAKGEFIDSIWYLCFWKDLPFQIDGHLYFCLLTLLWHVLLSMEMFYLLSCRARQLNQMRARLVCGRSRERSSRPATFFRGDWSWNNYCGHSTLQLIQEGQLLVTGERMCTKYWKIA